MDLRLFHYSMPGMFSCDGSPHDVHFPVSPSRCVITIIVLLIRSDRVWSWVVKVKVAADILKENVCGTLSSREFSGDFR